MSEVVRNVLRIDAAGKRLAALKAFVKGADGAFDFNTLIPMPKTLAIRRSPRTALGLLAVRFQRGELTPEEFAAQLGVRGRFGKSLEAMIGELVREGRCDLNLGEVALDNLREHGFPTWYEWRIANWGSKWNAFHAYADGWMIQFDSAWAPPWPVIRRLSEKFPALAVTHHWAGEYMGFDCGRMVLKGGAILDWEDPVDLTGAAYGIHVHCWGPSECLEQDEAGVWGLRNCADCWECD